MGRVVYVIVAIIVSLAGCASPPEELAATATSAAPRPIEVMGTGSIEGVVLDGSQLPLPNATVFLETSGSANEQLANTTTASDGSFRFASVEGGVYRVRATLEGFGEGAVLITVESDVATPVRLTLQDVPSALPYLELQQRSGIFRCAFAFVLMPETCDPILGAAGMGGDAGSQIANFTINAGHYTIVIETNWATQDTMDVWPSYVVSGDDWKYFQEVRGTPILRQELTPGQDFSGTYASLQNPDFYGAVPPTSEAFILNTETIFIGQYQDEADEYLNPVCVHTWGNCTGVGAALDFRFDQYVSTFYHAAPADLPSYSAIPKD